MALVLTLTIESNGRNSTTLSAPSRAIGLVFGPRQKVRAGWRQCLRAHNGIIFHCITCCSQLLPTSCLGVSRKIKVSLDRWTQASGGIVNDQVRKDGWNPCRIVGSLTCVLLTATIIRWINLHAKLFYTIPALPSIGSHVITANSQPWPLTVLLDGGYDPVASRWLLRMAWGVCGMRWNDRINLLRPGKWSWTSERVFSFPRTLSISSQAYIRKVN
jgi:hypothetical protein